MIIFPAIDLRQGRCVLLRQGDPEAETVVNKDPVAFARQWEEQGAEWLHIVNLDGALETSQAQLNALHRPSNILIKHPGRNAPESPESELMRRLPINLQKLREIRQAVKIPIQFGGGLRTLDDIHLALELGADRVVLGTIAVEKPDLILLALERWGPERIVVGIDAYDDQVAIHGWQTFSDVDPVDLGHRVYAMGVRHVVYTDIRRDGTLSGVNVKATTRLGDLTSLRVIASGGVADIYDIERLKAHEQYNIEGVVVGQSLYAETLKLDDAIEIGHRPLKHESAGIVPFRYENGEPQFLLLFNLFFEQWQFPRGGVDGGDCNQFCAMREFEEETGLSIVDLHAECRSVLNYISRIRDYEIERRIVYYLAEVSSQEISLGHENLCEARWLSAQDAWELLTDTAPEQLPALDAAVAYLHNLSA